LICCVGFSLKGKVKAPDAIDESSRFSRASSVGASRKSQANASHKHRFSATRRSLFSASRTSQFGTTRNLFLKEAEVGVSLVVEHAKQILERRDGGNLKITTDEFYAGYISLRSCPFTAFVRDIPSQWALPITSTSEDKLLRALGLSRTERNQIEGLASMSERGGAGFSEEQLAMAAVGRLAANPPAAVGRVQRLCAQRLLRPYPLGLRFSGNNMIPLPAWLAGAHYVALNMSNNDLGTQIHFALFNRSEGFVLKPAEMHRPAIDSAMRASGMSNPGSNKASGMSNPGSISVPVTSRPAILSRLKGKTCSKHDAEAIENQDSEAESARRSKVSIVEEGHAAECEEGQEVDAFWPPWREQVICATIEVISLHNLPKRGEARPLYDGRRGACHAYHPELSGSAVTSQDALSTSSRTTLTAALHAIGGFCSIGQGGQPLRSHETSAAASLTTKNLGGLNAHYGKTIPLESGVLPIRCSARMNESVPFCVNSLSRHVPWSGIVLPVSLLSVSRFVRSPRVRCP